MPSVRQPRSASMQYWPRKRAKRAYARVRHYPVVKEAGILAFAGYKVGMTHIQAIETSKASHLKGEEISIPVTIIECPPIKILSARFYKKILGGVTVAKEIHFHKKDKELARKITISKKTEAHGLDKLDIHNYVDIRVVVFTQPKLTGTGKKKPEIFEVGLGGSNEEKLNFIKTHADKEIFLDSVFKEGEYVDLRAVTIGKGFQGPIKRFGISLRQSKSEKSIRNPGSLGPWRGQGHIMYRVAHAGKMGYHQRTEHNKQIMKMIKDAKEINPIGGFLRYNLVKNPVVLIKGSVAGPKKRMIILEKATRLLKAHDLPTIQQVNTSSKQGR